MNTYTVLGDDDTFDSVDNVMVYIVDSDGDETLSNGNGFGHVENQNIVDSVSLSDLLSLWNEVHGTEF